VEGRAVEAIRGFAAREHAGENFFLAVGPPSSRLGAQTLSLGAQEIVFTKISIHNLYARCVLGPDHISGGPDHISGGPDRESSEPRAQVGLHKPHLPHVAPRRFFELYDEAAVSLPDERAIPTGFPREMWFACNEALSYPDWHLDACGAPLPGTGRAAIPPRPALRNIWSIAHRASGWRSTAAFRQCRPRPGTPGGGYSNLTVRARAGHSSGLSAFHRSPLYLEYGGLYRRGGRSTVRNGVFSGAGSAQRLASTRP
jgi:hypothetical protein